MAQLKCEKVLCHNNLIAHWTLIQNMLYLNYLLHSSNFTSWVSFVSTVCSQMCLSKYLQCCRHSSLRLFRKIPKDFCCIDILKSSLNGNFRYMIQTCTDLSNSWPQLVQSWVPSASHPPGLTCWLSASPCTRAWNNIFRDIYITSLECSSWAYSCHLTDHQK